MYQNYIFHLYGTLIDLESEEEDIKVWEDLSIYLTYYEFHYTALQLRLKMEQAKQKQLLYGKRAFQYPDYCFVRCFQSLTNMNGMSMNEQLAISCVKLYRSLTLRRLQLYDGVLEGLKKLKAKGKSLFLLAEGQKHIIEVELNVLGIYDLFDGMAISSEVGCKEPDVKFLHHLLEKYSISQDHAIRISNQTSLDHAGEKQIHINHSYLQSNGSFPTEKQKANCHDHRWGEGFADMIEKLEG